MIKVVVHITIEFVPGM